MSEYQYPHIQGTDVPLNGEQQMGMKMQPSAEWFCCSLVTPRLSSRGKICWMMR
jgi:hypothetical protein